MVLLLPVVFLFPFSHAGSIEKRESTSGVLIAHGVIYTPPQALVLLAVFRWKMEGDGIGNDRVLLFGGKEGQMEFSPLVNVWSLGDLFVGIWRSNFSPYPP
jgi:hypothetical protein